MSQIKTDLISARELIQQGWVKKYSHQLIEGQYCFCILGAINETAAPGALTGNGEVPWTLEEDARYEAMIAALGLQLGIGDQNSSSIIQFNDAPETTKEEVLTLFDKAIAAQPQD